MKIVILGIDGMSLDVLRNMSRYLGLSNILKVVNNGAATSVRTIIPPSSAPAWTSLFTGENPIQHGIFDFFDTRLLRNGVFSVDKKLSSYALWKKTLWSQASMKGKKTLIVGMPLFYPVHKVNGIYISGDLLIPQIDEKAVYPKHVYPLIQKVGYNKVYETMLDSIARLATIKLFEDDYETNELVESFVNLERKKFNMLMMSEQENNFELIIFITTAYDNLAHYFLDESNIPGSARLLRPYFIALDEFVKYFLSELNQDDFFFIVSDHGMHSVNRVFLVNNWLRKKQLLKTNGYSTKSLEINYFIRKFIPAVYKASRFLHMNKNLIKYMEYIIKTKEKGKNLIDLIDLECSTAYCLSYSSFGIFLKKRKLKTNLKKELESIIDTKNNKKIFNKVHIYKNNIYDYKAPDLIVEPAKGYTICTILPKYKKDILVNREKTIIKTADHTMDAIFIAFQKNNKTKISLPRKITDLHQIFLKKLE